MKLTTKIILTATLAILLIVLPTTVVCNYVVNSNADGRLYYDAASAPTTVCTIFHCSRLHYFAIR